MAISHTKKRKFDSSVKARLQANKKPKKQRRYDSDSSDEESQDDGKFVARDAPRKREIVQTPAKSAVKASKQQPKSSHAEKATVKASDKSDGSSDSESASAAGEGESAEGAAHEEEVTDDDESEETGDEEDEEAQSDISDSNLEDEDEEGVSTRRKKTKRHDPSAFANSLSTILSSKLPTSKRVDPVLARSREAQEAGHELAEGKLEAKAKRKLRDEKRLATEKGRVKDVLLGEETIDGAGAMSAADIAEQERRLRKTAQRGVVKLFNAVRASQVKSEEAARLVRQQGVVGEKKREERVGEMGRNAFLEMVGAGAGGS
jgi:hypothetical protein